MSIDSHSNSYEILVTGLVQGVGFRPFIWRLANDIGVVGCVYNHAAGVNIEVTCTLPECESLVRRIAEEAPILARVDDVSYRVIPHQLFSDFMITTTQDGKVSTGCAPDAATCNDCLGELFNKQDRRYGYPFINCTNCGPRLSIIKQIPYDREFTTMAEFTQCKRCQAEYDDPADRRFHAQPNACESCGPQIWFEDTRGETVHCENVFASIARILRSGGIVAIKGLGGFHLACDATNQDAVSTLRRRKHRPHKAFALMFNDIEAVKTVCKLSDAETQLLRSPAAPVVLLSKQVGASLLAKGIAPEQHRLGVMLPYTPIHHLLFAQIDMPLVMTSGNCAGQPQATSNCDARNQLATIADGFLMHNRDIHNRVDDSVVAVTERGTMFYRVARGYAPLSLPLPHGFTFEHSVTGMGAELKSTLCFADHNRVLLTQHLGDLEDAQTYEQYQRTFQLYQQLYQTTPTTLVADNHPEYLSTKFAFSIEAQSRSVVQVQHHHAHFAACLGENKYPVNGSPVLGICFDGTGLGIDKTLWGGEFLLGGYHTFERVAHLACFRLPGGTQAILHPWRTLYGQLATFMAHEDIDLLQDIVPQLGTNAAKTLSMMLKKDLNCPITSSIGRLFDAVAAILNCVPDKISYEGQGAITLETLALSCSEMVEPLALTIENNQIHTQLMWQQLIHRIRAGESTQSLAKAFHLGLVKAVATMVELLAGKYTFDTVALTGGVMQNLLLTNTLCMSLRDATFTVLTHHLLPANDANIAYGQVLIHGANSN